MITDDDLRDLLRRAETEGRRVIGKSLDKDPDDYEFIRLEIKWWQDDLSLTLVSRFWPRGIDPTPDNVVSVASTLENLMIDRRLE